MYPQLNHSFTDPLHQVISFIGCMDSNLQKTYKKLNQSKQSENLSASGQIYQHKIYQHKIYQQFNEQLISRGPFATKLAFW